MKIISKYKDFYDYLVQDHDADLTYVRKIGFVDKYYDNLFNKTNIHIPYYSKYYGYNYNEYYVKNRINGELCFDNFIFGIYPYIYSQPILRIYYYTGGNIDNKIIILGKDLVDRLKKNDKESQDKIIQLAQKEYDQLNYDIRVKVFFPKHLYYKIDQINRYVWKIECSELFYKIGAPVFVKDYSELFNGENNNVYANERYENKNKTIHYITNISFQKLQENILKYWYDELNDLNTYINIENFLWSIKQEPEAKPDNKTKILAHGFDLKTSFRKM